MEMWGGGRRGAFVASLLFFVATKYMSGLELFLLRRRRLCWVVVRSRAKAEAWTDAVGLVAIVRADSLMDDDGVRGAIWHCGGEDSKWRHKKIEKYLVLRVFGWWRCATEACGVLAIQ